MLRKRVEGRILANEVAKVLFGKTEPKKVSTAEGLKRMGVDL